ncbi:peptidylprolyl isomerase [Clostridium cadaveris]|uniref:peptidylprolyl isomerase n=1 Tax=Clostridium cadaveris TaxID=1529 RepID=UPI000C06C35B|nr:peptidylprolyl isomerase [Clostridium cadaveris]
MKNTKKIIAVALVAMLSTAAVGCNLIEKTPEAINKSVVAKVGSEKITYGDLDKELEYLKEQFTQQYGENYMKDSKTSEAFNKQKKSMLDSMVLEKVYLKKADELGLISDEEELNNEIETQFETMKAAFGDEDKFKSALEDSKLTEDSLKTAIKNSLIAKKVENYIIKDVTVEDSDIEAYYNENKDSKFTTHPGATLYHILVDSEDKAKEIKTKLDNGGDFKALAAEYGTDGTKDKGGELGFVEYTNTSYDADFMAAASKLKEGEISGPVKTQFGYHIIKATDLKTDAVVKPLDEVKDQIKTYLLQTKQNEAYTKTVDEWKKELKVEINEKNLNQ